MNFKVDQGPEGLEVELPALELIHKLGYDYKNHFELEDEEEIAIEELKHNMIPLKIKRPLPNNKYEIWDIKELDKKHLDL